MKNLGKAFGRAVVKARAAILIIAIVMLIPAVWGMTHTRVNYDLLTYLPDDIETIQGQDILMDEFGSGAVAMLVIDNKSPKMVSQIRQDIEEVEHVKSAIWYDSFVDLTVPMELLPDDVLDAFMNGDSTLMAIIFDSTTSSDETMDAIEEIREVLDEDCYLQGMSAVVTDTRDLTEKEEPIYVGLAVLLASIILALSMDTFLAPVFFLISIGMAILYNLGSNYFLGDISYITKALAAVLQLGVTMDYSIFLWHSFKECEERYPEDNKRAMAEAIDLTLQSVIGSSITTIAGFAALCFMAFTFGLDVGVCMMKGVAIGVVACVTILPSLILTFEKAINRTKHRPLIPELKRLPNFVQKHYRAILIVFVITWIPAIYGYTRTEVYYDLMQTLPDELDSMQANVRLDETFQQNNTLMILADSSLSNKTVTQMCDEIEDVPGVKSVIGLDKYIGAGIPESMLPDEIKESLSSENWQLLLVGSEYHTATDEINTQIDTINEIMDKYDSKAMLIGDAPCTKDLITISDRDFTTVNWVSIGIIFCIILLVFGSISLPVLLVLVIECAIFINMAIPYYSGEALPFIASIVIGTIQLGSTVDYAILMTSRYQAERAGGKSKEESVEIAHRTSIQSVIVSAFTFFAATFGVGLYSDITLISSLCVLMARGALISMVIVLTVLPAIFLMFDPIIVRTSRGFLPRKMRRHKSKDGDQGMQGGHTQGAAGRA